MFFWLCFRLNCLALKKIKLLLCKGKVQILHLLSCFWWCRNHLFPNNPAPSPILLGGKKQRCWWCLMRNSRCLITTDINLDCLSSPGLQLQGVFKFNATMIWRLPSLTLQCSSQLRPFFYSYIFFTFIIWQSLLSYLRDLQQWQFSFQMNILEKMWTETKRLI